MIPVYLCSATDNRVLSIDDPAVDQDLGVDFAASITSIGFEATAWSGFRRFIQTLHIGGSLTLLVAPIVDGSLDTTLTQAYTLDAATYGAVYPLRVTLATHGTRHQITLTIPRHSGATVLGEWRRHLVPRRTERGGP